MTPDEKVRENRLRRMAHRRGLTLEKCPRRDPGAIGYGTYRIVRQNDEGFQVVAELHTQSYGLTLDDVERLLGRYVP